MDPQIFAAQQAATKAMAKPIADVPLTFTPKVYANSSPGFALKPWELDACPFCDERTAATQPFQGCDQRMVTDMFPGFQSKPWAGISERFQRKTFFEKTELKNCYVD